MRRIRTFLVCIIGAAIAVLPAAAQSGGDFEITNATIDGGGGSSNSDGDVFVLAGTIGQHDSGSTHTGEGFS